MKVKVRFRRLDNGPYGWLAEAEDHRFIGVREYGPTKEAVAKAIKKHLSQEYALKRSLRRSS